MNIDFSRIETEAARAEAEAEHRRAAAIDVLSATDWALLRQIETGEPVPEEIRLMRAEARTVLDD